MPMVLIITFARGFRAASWRSRAESAGFQAHKELRAEVVMRQAGDKEGIKKVWEERHRECESGYSGQGLEV